MHERKPLTGQNLTYDAIEETVGKRIVFLNRKQAAKIHNMRPNTFHYRVEAGDVPAVRIGNQRKFRFDELAQGTEPHEDIVTLDDVEFVLGERKQELTASELARVLNVSMPAFNAMYNEGLVPEVPGSSPRTFDVLNLGNFITRP